jgi:hypothetical protein
MKFLKYLFFNYCNILIISNKKNKQQQQRNNKTNIKYRALGNTKFLKTRKTTKKKKIFSIIFYIYFF